MGEPIKNISSTNLSLKFFYQSLMKKKSKGLTENSPTPSISLSQNNRYEKNISFEFF
jgi:hypothetical protein